MKNKMFAHVAVVFSIVISFPFANAQSNQWVAPGEYTFGSCKGFGGDSAPTTYANQRYYDRYSCNKAYYEEDRCYVLAMHLERGMYEAGVLGECRNWLKNELQDCRNALRQLGRQCSTLVR